MPFAALQNAWDRTRLQLRGMALRGVQPEHMHLLRPRKSRWPRRCAIGAIAFVLFIAASVGGLWWRLNSGPIALDMFTPFLTSALESRVGGGRSVEVGGTILELDEHGRTAMRLHDIKVFDQDRNVVASAPKAEVGIAGGLLSGSLRATRIELIGAEMGVRIETDGRVTVFTGGETQKPIASVDAKAIAQAAAPATAGGQVPQDSLASDAAGLAALMFGWLQNLDNAGLDGGDLNEVGLRNGTISVDDARNGKKLSFANINFALKRLSGGGATLDIKSSGTDGPWSIVGSARPNGDGTRSIEAAIRDLSPKDVLLALRLDQGDFRADVPLNMDLVATLGADGTPTSLNGRILAGAGFIGDAKKDIARLRIDEMTADIKWDAKQRRLTIPIDLSSGASRVRLAAVVEPPPQNSGVWTVSLAQGQASLAAAGSKEAPVQIERVIGRATIDTVGKRLALENMELGGRAVAATLSASLDYNTEDPILAFKIEGGRMSLNALKRLWPIFIVPEVRRWVDEQMLGGTVEKVSIFGNAPLKTFTPHGPPLTNEQLVIEIGARNAIVRPLDALPSLKDVDVATRIVGHTVSIAFGKGTIDLPSGRKLMVAGGTFDIADTSLKPPMSQTRLRVEGGLDAAAEMLSMEALRDASGLPLDAATTKGNVVANIALAVPMRPVVTRNEVGYAVEAEITNFGAEKFFKGLKAEQGTLRISATHEQMQVKGDVKIGGMPSAVEYRTASSQPEAEVRVQATLDDAARNRLNLDFPGLSGSVNVKFGGRMKPTTREGRFGFEIDLKDSKINDLIPGWIKAAGRPARSTFTLVDRGQSMRLEDFVLEGSGVSVRGALEVDSQGELLSANFPTFSPSEGDKASLRIDKASDGAMRLTLRGDVVDGRGFVKASMSGQKIEAKTKKPQDFDAEVKIGVMTGHNGETMRSLDLKISRRAGQIRAFSASGKIGSNASINGSMEKRQSRQGIVVTSADAGALFRFADIYPRMYGGTLEVAMDPPLADDTPREGYIKVRNFAVRGEPALDGVAAARPGDPNAPRARAGTTGGVPFTDMYAEFTRSPGRFSVRDGVVRGPSVGGTVEGNLDYATNSVNMRGTFVPLYGLNNIPGQIPILGMFLGGSKEGLLGVTYQVTGKPNAPTLNVNPMSALAPGFLRKIFEFRGNEANVPTGRQTD
ncbi:hypothetical protein GJW-30_1_03405 [Variibacter gotjawalensis]|uniref:YhdP central domain-containing protein n=1 Tax=Variibacter gotjawalensis TaxID=1333996 RepID=A0A0S3PY42_9BRAD|nr:AsmA-like C-terminal region-containing protein [Variibacter gotjawalensis]NIK46690.1 hypothetical protein [Variibacter gotjawalensis]RZS48593.1 uncharacterized protein DUF3971 [Variibacter gotjawalensis]BAT60855.1 hypothetical protein GJW-30_1_03405 [Variibacter gotjawalensis]